MGYTVGLILNGNVPHSTFSYDILMQRVVEVTLVELLGEGSGNGYQAVYESPLCPAIGDAHPNFANMWATGPITINAIRGTDGIHPTQFEIVTPYEGAVNGCLWTGEGNLVQEQSSIDHNGLPTVVDVPQGLTPQQLQGMKYQPRAVRLPRWRGQSHRTLTFTANQPNGQAAGDFAYADALMSMVGTTNDANWGGRDNGTPRTWLWAQTNISTDNSVTFRIQIVWVNRITGWDEVGLYLDGNGNVFMDANGNVAITPPIPAPQDFAASTLGLSVRDGGIVAQTPFGWGRYIMTSQAPWQTTFDLDSSLSPNLTTLPSIADIH